MHHSRLLVDIVHEDILTQGRRCREVGFTLDDLRELSHKSDEQEITSKHERVDEDAGTTAGDDLLERLIDDERVESKGILVYSTVLQRQRRGLSIGDHDDLPHVRLFARQYSTGQPESFAGIGVEGSDSRTGQPGHRHLFRAVVKEHEVKAVSRKLRSDEMSQRESDPLRGRETIFTVQDHTMATI